MQLNLLKSSFDFFYLTSSQFDVAVIWIFFFKLTFHIFYFRHFVFCIFTSISLTVGSFTICIFHFLHLTFPSFGLYLPFLPLPFRLFCFWLFDFWHFAVLNLCIFDLFTFDFWPFWFFVIWIKGNWLFCVWLFVLILPVDLCVHHRQKSLMVLMANV